MSREEIDLEKEKLREHIRTCLISQKNMIHDSVINATKYNVQLKAWCITLFMVSVGFCLKESSKETILLLWLLPFGAIFLFWFNHAYRDYILNELYPNNKYVLKTGQILRNLYAYNFKELKEVSEEAIMMKIDWPKRGTFFWKRGFKKFFYYIPNSALSFENFFFFGIMFLLWLTICIIKFKDYIVIISVGLFLLILLAACLYKIGRRIEIEPKNNDND